MGRGQKYSAEQIVSLLRQIEVGMANEKMTPQACKEAGITEQTYYCWRKEYGGLQVDQARRLKELEQENAKLNLIDEFTRKCLAIHPRRRLNSRNVIEVVANAMIEHGIPEPSA